MSQNKERSGGQHKHGHGRKRHHQQKNNRQRQPRPAPYLNYESLLHRFMACVDCGYFFTAYRAHHGADVVHKALKASNKNRDGWIDLPWDLRTGELLHRFYEVRSDTHIDHLEFMCESCQRKFVCAELEQDVTEHKRHDEPSAVTEEEKPEESKSTDDSSEATAAEELVDLAEAATAEQEAIARVTRTLRIELKIR